MVLSSAAASTQTTILPTARTTLSMAVYKAIPPQFAKIHRKYLTPTVSTIVMGAISIVVYVAFNYMSNGIGIIGDAVIAIGLYIAFYYGLTGFACAWYYRRNLTSSARNLWMQGILPVAGGVILFFLGGWSVWLDYDVATANDYTMWTVPFIHWQIGGAFVIAVDRRDRRGDRLHLLQDRQPGVLPEGDADQGDADARAGRVADRRPLPGGPRRFPVPRRRCQRLRWGR